MRGNQYAILFTLLLALAITLPGCQGEPDAEHEIEAVSVVAENPELGTITDWFRTTGDIESPLEANVSFAINGLITDLAADEGDYVEAGQYLGQLDVSTFQAQRRAALSQANAIAGQAAAADVNIEIALNRVEQAEAVFELADTNYIRYQSLREDGVATQAEFEQVELQYENARVGLNSARDAVLGAEAQADTAYSSIQAARDNASQIGEIIADGTLRAPFNGRIVTRYLDPGNIVAPGTPIFKLLGEGDDVGKLLELRFDIPESMMGEVNVGTVLYVDLNSCDTEVETAVDYLGAVVDTETRTVKVVAYLERDSVCLLPGMFVSIRIPLEIHDSAVTIPENAIIEIAGEKFVYVVEGETARRRVVETGIREGDLVEITGGLDISDRVIVVGNTFLDDGVKIRTTSAFESTESIEESQVEGEGG
ncbi:efflux RND transporter periplasmic adaptor subunit [bacterium]|nr:efflux RND transporter periplasmic adaptor subunit [bacterium]